MESFPASDPPPWGPLHPGTPGERLRHGAVARLESDVPPEERDDLGDREPHVGRPAVRVLVRDVVVDPLARVPCLVEREDADGEQERAHGRGEQRVHERH